MTEPHYVDDRVTRALTILERTVDAVALFPHGHDDR